MTPFHTTSMPIAFPIQKGVASILLPKGVVLLPHSYVLLLLETVFGAGSDMSLATHKH